MMERCGGWRGQGSEGRDKGPRGEGKRFEERLKGSEGGGDKGPRRKGTRVEGKGTQVRGGG